MKPESEEHKYLRGFWGWRRLFNMEGKAMEIFENFKITAWMNWKSMFSGKRVAGAGFMDKMTSGRA